MGCKTTKDVVLLRKSRLQKKSTSFPRISVSHEAFVFSSASMIEKFFLWFVYLPCTKQLDKIWHGQKTTEMHKSGMGFAVIIMIIVFKICWPGFLFFTCTKSFFIFAISIFLQNVVSAIKNWNPQVRGKFQALRH